MAEKLPKMAGEEKTIFFFCSLQMGIHVILTAGNGLCLVSPGKTFCQRLLLCTFIPLSDQPGSALPYWA